MSCLSIYTGVHNAAVHYTDRVDSFYKKKEYVHFSVCLPLQFCTGDGGGDGGGGGGAGVDVGHRGTVRDGIII